MIRILALALAVVFAAAAAHAGNSAPSKHGAYSGAFRTSPKGKQ